MLFFSPDLPVLCLLQFPNEEDSFHKFVSPQEVLPFTEGTSSSYIGWSRLFFFFFNTVHLCSFASALSSSTLYCRIMIMVPDRWLFPVGCSRCLTLGADCFPSRDSCNFLKFCYVIHSLKSSLSAMGFPPEHHL